MRLTHLLRFLIQALYIVEFSIKMVVYTRSRLFEDFQIWFLLASTRTALYYVRKYPMRPHGIFSPELGGNIL